MGVSWTMRAVRGPGPRALGALAVVATVCGACAHRSATTAGAARLVPPLRVHTTNGFLWTAVELSPSLLYAARPEQAEVLASCREEAAYRRRWAFPALLVNLFTLPVGYFTFTFRCTSTLTVDVVVEARDGSEKVAFREQATASGVFFQYQKQPEPGDPDLSLGFEATRALARADLGRRVAARLAREWAQRHPERAARPAPATMDKGR